MKLWEGIDPTAFYTPPPPKCSAPNALMESMKVKLNKEYVPEWTLTEKEYKGQRQKATDRKKFLVEQLLPFWPHNPYNSSLFLFQNHP